MQQIKLVSYYILQFNEGCVNFDTPIFLINLYCSRVAPLFSNKKAMTPSFDV